MKRIHITALMTLCQLSFRITEIVTEHYQTIKHSELFSTRYSIISILGKGKGMGEKILQHKVKEAPEMKG